MFKTNFAGILDDETIAAMKKPRCGMEDTVSNGNDPAAYTAHSKWTNPNRISGYYELSYS